MCTVHVYSEGHVFEMHPLITFGRNHSRRQLRHLKVKSSSWGVTSTSINILWAMLSIHYCTSCWGDYSLCKLILFTRDCLGEFLCHITLSLYTEIHNCDVV